VKCRIGVDAADSYDALCNFVSVVSERSPATHFVIHARTVRVSSVGRVQGIGKLGSCQRARKHPSWVCLRVPN
jgi:tRNA-dihydrouridine synthase